MNKKISFLGIGVDALNRKEIREILLSFAQGDRPRAAYYLNAHCVNIACADDEYKTILNKADLVYTGGQGVVWASGFLGVKLPERVNILDFFDEMVLELIDKKVTIYLLGERGDTVGKAKKELENRGLNIIGFSSGFFTQGDEPGIIEEINALKPDILMVGMGVPKQEKWIYKHLGGLNVRLCWAVGGVFKILSGELKRTPGWVINAGLEWLYLGLQDPERLVRRYLTGNVGFLYNVLKWKIAHEKNI